MKNIFVLLLCFYVSNSIAQSGPFIRVYNNQHHKFIKGRLQMTSDSGLILLKKGKDTEEIKYTFIHKIRLKRSAGMTALIVGGIPMVYGIVLSNSNKSFADLAGAIVIMEGLVIGPTAGGIKALLNPKPLLVEGNHQKWMEAKMKLDQKLSK